MMKCGTLRRNPIEVENMSNYVKETKDETQYSIEVRVPVRRVKDGMTFEEMSRAPIINIENRFKSTSILSKLDGKNRTFSNIEGMAVTMVCRVHDDVTSDEVIVRGERGNFYIVEIGDKKYSVNKSCAMFTVKEE